jgi:hypothetical protein
VEGVELARFVRGNHRSGLEVAHYVDNPLARIDELERRLEELERFALSGLFESGGTTLGLPGGLEVAGAIVVDGRIEFIERGADPDDPAEGHAVLWMSDGTGSGDDGDILIKITAGGSTKSATLVDFSAL